MLDSFPVSKDLWKISCRIGANSVFKVCRTMGLNLSGPGPYVGSSLQAACQCLQQLCLYQAFWGRDWAGMDFWARDLKLMGVLGLNTD